MYPGSDHLAALDLSTLWSAIEAAAEQAGIAVYVTRIDSDPPVLLFCSLRAAEIAGRPIAELIGTPPSSWLHPAAHDGQDGIAQPSRASAPRLDVVERPDGTQVPVEVTTTRITGPTGMFRFGYFRELSGERETLAALRQSEAQFRFLVEAAPDGVVILQSGTIVFINPKAARLLGVPEGTPALGRRLAEFLPPAEMAATAARIAEMFRTGAEMPANEYRILADPTRVVEIKSIRCDWERQPAVLAFARDVTERKAIQRRLVEADRLAALGTLAAGVAHEINNPLTYAQLSVQRIERALAGLNLPAAAVATLREHLNDIDHGISRVASITQSLRTFARGDDAPPGPVDLNLVIDQALKMVATDLRHRAELVRSTADIPSVVGNAAKLEQVIVNLVLNALQALRDVPPGAATIEVSVASRGADAVVVTVRDTGHGIPAAIRDLVFDPFFTTKAVGSGMGLGLSVCKSIVESFGGEIALHSIEGVGTTATVVLRVHHAAAITTPATSVATAPAARLRVLLVDDEPMVRRILSRLLADHHDVTTADSGGAALDALAGAAFDVIMCDVMMPGMSGRDVHRTLARERPGLERTIVFMTGGTFDPGIDEFIAASGSPCLMKPFALEQVLGAIGAVTRPRSS